MAHLMRLFAHLNERPRGDELVALTPRGVGAHLKNQDQEEMNSLVTGFLKVFLRSPIFIVI